jgi:hypothetical protein
MLGADYPTKKALKEALGEEPRFIETSPFGPQYSGDGRYSVVGPDPYRARNWYAMVTIENGVIKKVE